MAEANFSDVIRGTAGNGKSAAWAAAPGGAFTWTDGPMESQSRSGAGDDWVSASGGADYVQGDDQIDGMAGNDVLEGGDGKDTIRGDGIVKAGFMNTVAAQHNGGDFVDGGAGDDTLTGGGSNVVLINAIYFIATCARHWGVTGQFDCEIRAFKARKQCFRWPLDRSNIKTAHARSMRLAGHRWLGRRMDGAWGSSGIQINTQKWEVPQ